jgi:hypothetical protein
MLLSLLLFIVFFATLTLFGEVFVRKILLNSNRSFSFYERLPMDFLFGLAAHIAIAHFVAFISSSYKLSSLISFALIAAYLLYLILAKKFNPKEFFIEADKTTWILSVGTLLISIICGIRGHLTDSDNTHIAWMSSIVRNNFYPPSIPVEKDYFLTFYHYGIDLIGSSIYSITGLMPWDTISFQVGIGAFLVISSVFCFSGLFLNKVSNRLIATFVICFFTCTTAIEFFYKYLPQISQMGGIYEFLHHWQNAALPAVGNIPYFLVLVSQSMGLSAILIILVFVYISQNNSYKQNYLIYSAVALLSFIAYFCYAAFWYPTIIGLAGYLFLKNISNFKLANFLNPVFILLSLFIGKLMTLQFSSTSFNGVEAMIVQPSLYWDHFAMNFLGYFDFNVDNNLIKPITDFVSGKTIFSVHLLAMTTMRNFGFVFIFATLIAIYKLVMKQKDYLFVLYLSAIPALVVPFVVRFVLKPTETYRFPSWAVVCLVIFSVISILSFIEAENNLIYKLSRNIFIKILVVFHVLLLTAPGVVAVLPNFSYIKYTLDDLLDEKEKALVKELMKYQHSGDIALTDKIFYSYCEIVSVAGFYGVGGQMYKPDMETRKTALFLLNPLLLQELNVKYILIYKDDVLSPIAISRLSDPALFSEIIDIYQVHPDYRFFVFKGSKQYSPEEIASMQSEYKWILGTKFGPGFSYVTNNNQLVAAQTKQELQPALGYFRTEIAKQNKVAAVWLSTQAIHQ